MAGAEFPYLRQRAARLAYERLKREIVFALVLSTMALTIGAWRYFIVVGADERIALALVVFGIVGLVLALILPCAWIPLERALSWLMGKIGGALFGLVLSVVYFTLITPVGWFLRRHQGSGPIHSWLGEAPGRLPGWIGKEVAFDAPLAGSGTPSLWRRWAGVLRFFAERGHYVFLPALVVLIALGLALFFVKSSALAPLIYTLF